MKKILSIFMLLVAFTTGAWAGDEWSIDFVAMYKDAGFSGDKSVTISSEVAKIGGTSMGTCSVEGVSINSNFVLQTSTSWLLRTGGLYQFNSGGRAMGMLGCTKDQIITIVGTGNPNPSTNVTLKSQDGNTYIYTVNADGDVKFTPARYLYFTSISVANPSATAVDYTVKYVDGEGTEIKTASIHSGDSGSDAVITASDKDPIYANDMKYVYVSDDSAGKKIASDGSTVVTIVFDEAGKYSYTLNLVDDEENILKQIVGQQFNGDEKKVYYPKTLEYEGKYYTTPANGSYPWYAYIFKAAETKNIIYTIDETLNYFFEVEDLGTSHSWAATGTQPDRYSNGLAGRLYKGSYAFTEPLEGGVYTLTMWARNNASSSTANIEIIVRDPEGNDSEPVQFADDWGTSGQGAKTIENITIPTGSFLVLNNNNAEYNSNLEMDYVILTKTGDAPAVTKEATIPSSGIGTFASAYALDCSKLPNGVKAYKVSMVSANGATLEEVTTAVAPGTGLILRGTAGTYDIPVVAEGTDISGTNELKAAVTATDIEANTAYILQGGQFHLVNAASTVPAGKAYLPANVNSARSISLSFGEITGVSEVAAEAKAVADGKFIKNGQLVIEKNGKVFNANGAQVK